MRHHRQSVKFGRQRSHYKATLKSLVSALIISKSIHTTKTKAKAASRLADKLITLGKEKTVTNQRRAYAILCDRKLVSMLFNDIAPLFKDRLGGYTRVMLTGNRHGDNAQMAILEFIEKPKAPEHEKKSEKKEKKPTVPVGEGLKPSPTKEEKNIPLETKKEERKKETPQPKKHDKPIQRPGFFKKFFGRKGD